MIAPPDVRIARFDTAQQAAVRALVLAGLAERWGGLDPTLNGVLDDIETTYSAANVVVASAGADVAGCGMLVVHDDSAGEVVRMAIDAAVARRAAALHVPDPAPWRDALIGATALVNRMVVVTRNAWYPTNGSTISMSSTPGSDQL
ncbi:MAG: hypothetical protein ACRDZN_00910, partial [Acidimicrobiales bacterium]